jgi:crossover junction endodeoxyribonuclease RuvC
VNGGWLVRVLGVDPGLTRCGVGVVEGTPGRPCTLVDYGVVRSEPDDELAHRLLALEVALDELIARHRPDAIAVERVFSQHNVRTVMGTAQAGAVAILTAARAGLPVQTYTPSEVKAAVTGSGQADKAQVTTMVTRLLGLAQAPKPADAADALALAICHVWRGGTRARLAAAAAKNRAAIAAAKSRAAAAAKERVAAAARHRAALAAEREPPAGRDEPAAGRGEPLAGEVSAPGPDRDFMAGQQGGQR